MTDRISSLRLFVRVARTGSFTAAGKEAGLSQPSVSRIVSQLEKSLGAALFVRSTHAVKLTEAGLDYLARIEPLLFSLEEANQLVRGDGELRGRLRIGAATSVTMREVIPRLPTFLERHPNLHVDLVLTDSHQELVGEGIDVVIRFGPLADSAMVARKIADSPRIVVASPTYLAKMGTPQAPAELVDHRVIVGPSGALPTSWRFERDGKTTSVRVKSQLNISVNEAATAAATAGMGLISTALLGCREEVENGTLVQLFPDWDLGQIPLSALLPGGGQAKASARAFADFMITDFRGEG